VGGVDGRLDGDKFTDYVDTNWPGGEAARLLLEDDV